MYIDLHVHTKRCHHAEGDLEDYIKEAIKNKIKIIGFSEHAPLPFDLDKRLSLEEAKKYVQDVENLKIKYEGQIKILCGFEVDYLEQFEDQIREFVESINTDFFLGSIHFINKNNKIAKIWDYKEVFNNKNIQEEYFNSMIKAIETGLFDSISHPDLIFRSGLTEENLKQQFNKIFKILSKNNVNYEINCSGFFKTKYSNKKDKMTPGGFLSKLNILEASKLGVRFTIGSDAHKIQDLGKGIDKMLDFARENKLLIDCFEKGRRINIIK
jgi:histidinol-phosphatase (PHP family)